MIADRLFQMNCAWLFLGLGLLGCGPSLPPKIDAKVAREALVKSLDTWAEGKSVETLKALNPPISFRDTHWEKGSTLIKYQIEKEESVGHSGRFTVKLSLTEKAGAKRDRTVVYVADAGSTIVIRPDF
jgi:hypothetical protein